jgi:hypothetical protein
VKASFEFCDQKFGPFECKKAYDIEELALELINIENSPNGSNGQGEHEDILVKEIWKQAGFLYMYGMIDRPITITYEDGQKTLASFGTIYVAQKNLGLIKGN